MLAESLQPCEVVEEGVVGRRRGGHDDVDRSDGTTACLLVCVAEVKGLTQGREAMSFSCKGRKRAA